MKRLSIKLRVTIWCTLLAAAVAAVALSAMVGSEQRLLMNYYRDSLLSTAKLAMDDIHYKGGRLDIDRNLDDLPSVRVALYSAYGDLIYGRERFTRDLAPGGVYEARGADGTNWYVYDELLSFEEGEDVYLRCYMPMDAADNVRVARSYYLWVSLPVLVLLAALGGYAIARRAFQPVAQIVSTARGISDGADLKKRIPLSGNGDELTRLAAVCNDMLERLERAFERERRFTADVSHELRTPLAAILMQCEFALSDLADETDRREALEDVQGSARHLSELAARLLTLARMDAHQVPLRPMEMNLHELALTAAQVVQEQAAARGIHVTVTGEEQVPLQADETLLLQAAVNLAANAVRYGREGGWVRLRAERRGRNEVALMVEDDGVGIDPAALPHLFERFYQADHARHGEGAGLGLSLTEGIVRLHGGRIEVTSRMGEGSTFTMILPTVLSAGFPQGE